ncbi:MAG: cytochrome c3 family protein, partial [Desulfobacteraceae bacterium]
MDENHEFPCLECHLLPADRGQVLGKHAKVLRHPAAPEHVVILCGECHQKEISILRNSLHYTLAGMIGQTRYLWGAQENPMPRYAPSDHPVLKPLPPIPVEPETASDLVDDLLQRRCFRCHLGQLPPQKKGLYRGLGCSACHVFYSDDGIYRGGDATLRGKRGYPEKHAFVKPIPVGQCLHCHNGPRVGADYVGLFEHDYHMSYRTPWRGGSLPEPIYLMDHHHLSVDIHQEKGLLCVDCHDQGDVMGRGKLSVSQQEAVEVRCEQCHGPWEAPDKKEASPDSAKSVNGFLDRQGRRHPLPQWEKSVPAHSVEEMRRLHCTSCHAAWGFYDYGPSLIRDDRPDLSRWGAWRLQGDATIASLFDPSGRLLEAVDGPGPWFLNWHFRRWENLHLGVDSKDRIVPFRPHYQYMVSFVDKSGSVLLDSVIPQRGDKSGRGWAYMPFYPHTVRSRGRSCEDCHGESLAVGKGYGEEWGSDLPLTRADKPVYPALRLLNEPEMKRLMEQTSRFREVRSRVLREEMGPKKEDPKK